jgi:hypothetical protein
VKHDEYIKDSGTSQATAFVSGALAILRGETQSAITNEDILKILRSTSNRLERPETWVGSGLVNVKKALEEVTKLGWIK